jgi:DNA helicase II / ATP-dependent DNA helicase PcrA
MEKAILSTMNQYELNDEQWRTIIASSPTMVNASAGSGKTRCLISKIRHILDNGAPVSSICAITFTNKAAKEMKERLKKYCEVSKMQVSTIHSMCVKIIHKFAHHTPLKTPFSIYDDGHQTSIVKTIMKARDMEGSPYEFLSAISRAKSEQAESRLSGDYLEIYNTYQEILLKNNACDFDDLLIYALKCTEQPDCKEYFTNLWRHILVDEFQDTSVVQYKIILNFYNRLKTKTLYIVGDHNQSIYGFRGARPDNIVDFIEKHKPTICDLTYNYRSHSEIISHANKFLHFGKPMVAKSAGTGRVSFTQFNNQEDEANRIADAIQKMGDYSEIAILYRTNARSLFFERALASRRIPYKVVGDIPFYRRKIVKDLMSFCRAAENQKDIESLNRIVNVPKRGFGGAKQERLLKEGWPFLEECAQTMPAINSFVHLLNDIKGRSPKEAIQMVLNTTGYRSTLEKESDHSMLETFLEISSAFSTTEELILASTFLEEDSGRGVKLMTAHASKGLEFDRVFVVGVEREVWPHKLSLNPEEEERLYYVACSRARKFLNVSYSRSKTFRGIPVVVDPSYLFLSSCRK